jgi:cellulase
MEYSTVCFSPSTSQRLLIKSSYPGYDPRKPASNVVGWSTPSNTAYTFVGSVNYTNPSIICHFDATNAQLAAPVKAGGTVELIWAEWFSSHLGPVMTYLANCHGPCETVDKTTLEFFKIDEVGLIEENIFYGYWGSSAMIKNNYVWSTTIPKTLVTGNYVLRHEVIPLHLAYSPGYAQATPQCINLAITGTGTDSPPGIKATKFYKENDPGILINIFQNLTTYHIPGPTLWTGAAAFQTQTTPGKATATASGVYTVMP